MKQRIRVVGVVEDERGILLLKRGLGRSTGVPKWELLTSKIEFGEQPDEAMVRAFVEYIGVEVKEIKLKDVVTFVGIEGASRQGNLFIIYNVKINREKKMKLGDRYTAYRYLKKGETVGMRLDEATSSILELVEKDVEKKVWKELVHGATVYVDGSSRGNPGPSGVGYYIVGENGEVLKRGGEFIGFATSRIAEYFALKEGCEQAIELGLKNVRFVGDNLMMINQMNGIYRVKNKDLVQIYGEIQKLLENFETYSFTYVCREDNTEADKEANLAVEKWKDE